MCGFEASGDSLSVNTSPLLRKKYIELRNLPFGRSSTHSEISVMPDKFRHSSFISHLKYLWHLSQE